MTSNLHIRDQEEEFNDLQEKEAEKIAAKKGISIHQARIIVDDEYQKNLQNGIFDEED